jgi:hypothetical protein
MNTDSEKPTSITHSTWAKTETAVKDVFERTEEVLQEAIDESARAMVSAGTSLKKAAKSPAGGATIAGGTALGAAAVFGALPTLLGAGAAYVTYLVVRKRRPHAPA